VIVGFTNKERSIIQTHRDATRNITIIGQIVRRFLAFHELNAWTKEMLHNTLESIVLLGNGYFEATFLTEVGSLHALAGKYFMGASEVILARWSTLFSLEQIEMEAKLRYSIWLQIQRLGKHLRNETCLLIGLASKLGRVLKVKTLEFYRAKTVGYHIKILRGSIHDLPKTIVIAGEKLGEATKHGLLFSGLPNQCRKCQKFSHFAKHCNKPKNPIGISGCINPRTRFK